jgi:hypothetical protein
MYVRKLCAKVREQTVVAHFAKTSTTKGTEVHEGKQ